MTLEEAQERIAAGDDPILSQAGQVIIRHQMERLHDATTEEEAWEIAEEIMNGGHAYDLTPRTDMLEDPPEDLDLFYRSPDDLGTFPDTTL